MWLAPICQPGAYRYPQWCREPWVPHAASRLHTALLASASASASASRLHGGVPAFRIQGGVSCVSSSRLQAAVARLNTASRYKGICQFGSEEHQNLKEDSTYDKYASLSYLKKSEGVRSGPYEDDYIQLTTGSEETTVKAPKMEIRTPERRIAC